MTGFENHDHAHCVGAMISNVEDRCAAEGLRLTPVRRRVLEILGEQHRALGAYAVLDRLSSEGHGSQPPVVYRALDFLVEHGFVHKIEKLNAYVACSYMGSHMHSDHAPVFMVCRLCSAVAELEAGHDMVGLSDLASATGFTPERAVIEVTGLCPACRQGQVGRA
ncbi:ferric uptake regulator family protein [Ketogulonicigenium robustum]|uniref:Ferric uptake regulator family protein n=1 Tax=Ketogulonicigenium robustum TaxID=92947 RepID=A0A1W6NY53_9RHOB|nr:transcriptional repressor [Ketogulonicigenium robustum]ARO14093.1 ferric uptake regulator family protein [Ketogulonicigenium robustum]